MSCTKPFITTPFRFAHRRSRSSPQEYRAQLDAHRAEVDLKPKTVFYDRLDFTHGQPKVAVVEEEQPAPKPHDAIALSRAGVVSRNKR